MAVQSIQQDFTAAKEDILDQKLLKENLSLLTNNRKFSDGRTKVLTSTTIFKKCDIKQSLESRNTTSRNYNVQLDSFPVILHNYNIQLDSFPVILHNYNVCNDILTVFITVK